MTAPRRLQCDSHGSTPWRGTVICARDAGGCGRVWKLIDPNAHTPPPELGKKCVCGAQLVVERDPALDAPTPTARAICGDCYAERRGKPS